MTPTDYLGLAFDPRDAATLVAHLRTAATTGDCITIVTPNVDHMVRLHRAPPAEHAQLWDAYRKASLRINDSRVLARLAALSGRRLPVVPGSDLTAALFSALRPGDQVTVVGGDAATTADLARLRDDVTVVQHVPPMGMRRQPAAMAAAAEFVLTVRSPLTLLAVGSPQQELLAQAVRADPRATGVVLCIGAGVEFLTGRVARAPRWMQRSGLEWLHRLASDPRRLWRRYLVDGPYIFRLAWNARRSR